MKKNWQSNNNWPKKKKNVNSMGRIFLQNNNNMHNIHLHTHTQAESKHTKNETNYDVDDDDDDDRCTELYQTKWINKKQQQHTTFEVCQQTWFRIHT